MSAPDLLCTSRGRYVFDLETDNLLADVTVIHCAVAIDVDTDEVHDFGPVPCARLLPEFFELYRSATLLVGHNIISFDIEVLKKLHGIEPPKGCELVDTMILAQIVNSDIKATDYPAAKKWKAYAEKVEEWEAGKVAHEEREADPATATGYTYPPLLLAKPLEFPGQFCGRHSLEAWGYRMGAERKGDYSKEMKALGLDPWSEWRPEMHSYMIQDGVVNLALYRYLMAFKPPQQAIELEMRVQALCQRMERNGWPFDVKAAQALYATLSAEREVLSQSLRSLFPPWEVELEDFIPARDNKTKGYKKGVPVPRSEIVEFNPGSRDHIANRLTEKYGWKPTEFTPSGKPEINDATLQALPYPEAKQLALYFTLQKRIGQLAEGDKAWLKCVTQEGRIHGRYQTLGTVTGRMSHYAPNIAQVPAVGALFGRECRALFTVPAGWRQLGADQSGLELRCLGSFLSNFDDGAYNEIVLNGDVHWENAVAIWALPGGTVRDDTIPSHKKMRGHAKTIIYALLYGAQNAKIGSIVGKGSKAGATIRSRLEGKFPALKQLVAVVKAAAKKGYIKGLDGRHIPIRGEHAALNSLLQSAGSLICKRWFVDADDALRGAGLCHGWGGDYVFLGLIHDEAALAVRDGVDIEEVSRLIIEAGRRAGDAFESWACPTDVEVKVGSTWAETH